MVLGATLLLVSLGQYGYMMLRQHQLRQQLELQYQQLDRPLPPGAAGERQAAYARTPTRGPRAEDADLRLVIPAIHMDDAVVHGTSYNDLLVAPGLLAGSPLPAEGGNTVIAGHRDTFFRQVADLHAGDFVELDSGGQAYEYEVTGREIVSPSDTAVLDNTPRAELTLVTCYPTYWIGPAPKRLIVTAARVQ